MKDGVLLRDYIAKRWIVVKSLECVDLSLPLDANKGTICIVGPNREILRIDVGCKLDCFLD